MATRTSWLRVRTPALLKSSWMFALTEVSEVRSCAAISLLPGPSIIALSMTPKDWEAHCTAMENIILPDAISTNDKAPVSPSATMI